MFLKFKEFVDKSKYNECLNILSSLELYWSDINNLNISSNNSFVSLILAKIKISFLSRLSKTYFLSINDSAYHSFFSQIRHFLFDIKLSSIKLI